MKPIRVLHVFGGLDAGGAESRTMDIYRQIDRKRIQFDFLIHTKNKGFFEEEIIELGGRVYRIPRFGVKSILLYFKEVNKFFEDHSEYKIVHGHILSTAFIYQAVAKYYNVPVRIAHSRCGSRTELRFENIIKEIFKRLVRFYVTDQFAVSQIAGESAFGGRNVLNGKVRVIPNAIKSNKYQFNQEVRNRMRLKFVFDNKLVVGHIGRFQEQKNHRFVVEIFNELLSLHPNSVLLLIGDGELQEDIKNQVKNLGISEKVIFAGIRPDVPDLLQAMDILLFPSFYEGLPGVVLESQAAGLNCIISDTITREVKITELVEYVSLQRTADYWAKRILDRIEKFSRKDNHEEFIKTGYDIISVAKWYEEFYLAKYFDCKSPS